jgi:hypothetical protein
MRAASLCRAAVAGALGMATLLAPSPTAVADPVPPPPDPAVVVPADPAVDAAPAAVPAPDPFAANSQATKENPLMAFTALMAQPSPATLLVPPASAGTAENPLIGLDLLMPTSYGMPTGDAASPYVLGEGNNGPFARVNAFKGVHALGHAGLGRMPRELLGQPLPGTAPPPGTAVPAGLEQFYVDPAELLPPAPAPTGAAPVVPTPAPAG